MILIGFHAVESMLSAGKKVHMIHLLQRGEAGRPGALLRLTQKHRVPVKEYSSKDKLKFEQEFRRLGGQPADLEGAQGVFAQVPDFEYTPLVDLLNGARESCPYPIVLFLDEVTDPQNVGAILRSSAFFGVTGVVLPEHRSSPITPVAIKISSGGLAHVPVAKVTNLARGIEEAKEAGFWAVGLSEHAEESLDTARLDVPLALVIGSEEKGIRDLTAKTCDYTLSLPAQGSLKSLNAAMAAAVALALVRERQRLLGPARNNGR
ncbi:MAG: 23S rRNA (guanosine(2251)-2'-O)-methyltransferase RlmB [Bdellovibrionales bacterium]|nr:23S rRNA (guanosine(2251)-2'-O)-methyltransferase RlmB [Bdellovibrionales bacterium]